MDKDKLLQATLLERQIEEINSSLEMIEKQIIDLNTFIDSIKNLKNSHEKEILSPVVPGVFLKSDIKDLNLFVNIGSGIFIKKNPEQTAVIIEKQITKLSEARFSLAAESEIMKNQLESLIIELSKSAQKTI